MNEFKNEMKEFKLSAEDIKKITINSKNYRIVIVQGSDTNIVIRYHNNTYRRMNVEQKGQCLFLEEQMAVTFYEFFRFMELVQDNELIIEIPVTCNDLNLNISTNVTNIVIHDITANTLDLSTATGHIFLYYIDIHKRLLAHSSAGMIKCYVNGKEEDYDIDCYVDRKDIVQPYYPPNTNAYKKISLLSKIYIPELFFN